MLCGFIFVSAALSEPSVRRIKNSLTLPSTLSTMSNTMLKIKSLIRFFLRSNTAACNCASPASAFASMSSFLGETSGASVVPTIVRSFALFLMLNGGQSCASCICLTKLISLLFVDDLLFLSDVTSTSGADFGDGPPRPPFPVAANKLVPFPNVSV
uniref:Uncharacterized protein n=1 Tax=Cacopsylla melanoneura TaxID=428564 RepID=A0A8D8ZDI4_9HEMI